MVASLLTLGHQFQRSRHPEHRAESALADLLLKASAGLYVHSARWHDYLAVVAVALVGREQSADSARSIHARVEDLDSVRFQAILPLEKIGELGRQECSRHAEASGAADQLDEFRCVRALHPCLSRGPRSCRIPFR